MWKGKFDVIKFLLGRGADSNSKDDGGRSCWDLAVVKRVTPMS